MVNLENRVALVLGGTGSIGAAICGALENEGAKAIRHGLETGDYRADVSKEEDLRKLLDRVSKEYGKIDILVNSVSAPLILASFEKKTWEDFSAHLNVQLKAAVFTAKFFLPGMVERKFGRIVNIITSAVEDIPPSHMSDYVTAKYAMLGLTRALAKEYARFGVTVNAVSPGLIKNDFTKNMPEKMVEIMEAQSPSGRLITPEDVAKIVVSLAGEESKTINGENILVA